MNIRTILTGSIALATLVTTVKAADVEIRITGATAFRTATMNAIKAQFETGGNYVYAHNQVAGSFNAADRCTFKGAFPGVTGTTTVRCSWNGSVEGLRAIAIGGTAFDPAFITDAALASPGTDAGEQNDATKKENANKTGETLKQLAKFAFSDCRQSSTPIASPVLEPSDPAVAITLFTMITNNGAPASWTNVGYQAYKGLLSAGSYPLSLFTGDPADTKNVYATGRNDGSGTRTIYMAESGRGITTLVNQFVRLTNSGTNITSIQRVPAGGVNDSDPITPGIQPYTGQLATNASTVWSQDSAGNGGYFSGSTLRGDMSRSSTGVTVRDSSYTALLETGDILLLTFLTAPDARTAATTAPGGKILGWNGSRLDSLGDSLATELSLADRNKVTTGQYTAWSTQNLYYNGSLSTDEDTVYTAIKGGIDSTIISAGYFTGIPIGDMACVRDDDGAPVGF